MIQAVLQQKVFLLEHFNLHLWGPDSLVPLFQPRHRLWGWARWEPVMTPTLNNTVLSLAAEMTSGPRETTQPDQYHPKPKMLIL